jgi:hypothetical protein
MAKIVYNCCYGGFSLSEVAVSRYSELSGLSVSEFYDRDIDRDDPLLVQVVEELGQAANGGFAKLYIAEVPSGTKYRIDEYDGLECIMTPDDYDWSVAR